jgi:hypothetical protein
MKKGNLREGEHRSAVDDEGCNICYGLEDAGDGHRRGYILGLHEWSAQFWRKTIWTYNRSDKGEEGEAKEGVEGVEDHGE